MKFFYNILIIPFFNIQLKILILKFKHIIFWRLFQQQPIKTVIFWWQILPMTFCKALDFGNKRRLGAWVWILVGPNFSESLSKRCFSDFSAAKIRIYRIVREVLDTTCVRLVS